MDDKRTVKCLRLILLKSLLLSFWWCFRSADNSVRLFDHRKISGSGQALPVEQFEGHSAAVLCVQVPF